MIIQSFMYIFIGTNLNICCLYTTQNFWIHSWLYLESPTLNERIRNKYFYLF